MNIQYYDKETIHQLNWEAYSQGDYFQRLYKALITKGTPHFIENVNHPLGILCVNDRIYPLVLGTQEISLNKSYVASAYSQYVLYGKREIDLEFDNKLLATLGKAILSSMAYLFRFKRLEQAVFVNNWLLSTNLYPKSIPEAELLAIKDFLKMKFPDRAIIFRSLNYYLNSTTIQELKDQGFSEIFSRKVFLTDTKGDRNYREKRNFGHDLKLWKKSSSTFRWERLKNIEVVQAEKIRTLYKTLYLEKYSSLNPDFTLEFFLHMIKEEILITHVLKEQEEIIAVLGYFKFEGVQTASVIGYDPTYPKKAGLYRLISLKIVELAEENGTVVHASSGVSAFKASRGLEAYMEYNLVYFKHLTLFQKLPWSVLRILANNVTIPLMRKFEI